MFTVRAKFTDTIEIFENLEIVRSFFTDVANFADLMPDIESVHCDHKGVAHWRIRAEVPFVGVFAQKFAVELAEESEERIEWMPVAGEERNFLRYAADFLEKESRITMVNFTQMVELRRRSATELHLFAGVVGESFISGEMTKRVAQMIRGFVVGAKEKIERG
jgi:uncharacterized membrane protein